MLLSYIAQSLPDNSGMLCPTAYQIFSVSFLLSRILLRGVLATLASLSSIKKDS